MNNNRKMVLGIALITLGILSMSIGAYALVSSLILHNTGTVGLVKAYQYDNATGEITTLEWGNVLPDSVQNKTVWLKNYGSVPVTITLTVTNWVPSNAGDYMHVSWNRESETMTAGSVLQATIFLTVFANATAIPGPFSMDINIHEAW